MTEKILLKVYLEEGVKIVDMESFPFTLGRSIKNTLSIDKATVSASHAVIEDQVDGLYLIDCGSTNGIFFQGQRIEKLKLEKFQSFYLGEMRIEILGHEDYLDKTQEIELPKSFLKIKRSDVITQVVLSYFYFIIPEFIKIIFTDPINKDNYQNFLIEVCGLGIMALMLAGLSSLFSKIHCKKYQFIILLKVANIWMGAISLSSFLPVYFYFYLDINQWRNFFEMSLFTILFCLLFYQYSLILFKKSSPRKIISIISTIVMIATSIKIFFNFYHERWGNYDYLGSIAYPLGSYTDTKYPLKNLLVEIDERSREIERLRKQANIELEEEQQEDQKNDQQREQ